MASVIVHPTNDVRATALAIAAAISPEMTVTRATTNAEDEKLAKDRARVIADVAKILLAAVEPPKGPQA